jgi:hypothetical protein
VELAVRDKHALLVFTGYVFHTSYAKTLAVMALQRTNKEGFDNDGG